MCVHVCMSVSKGCIKAWSGVREVSRTVMEQSCLFSKSVICVNVGHGVLHSAFIFPSVS